MCFGKRKKPQSNAGPPVEPHPRVGPPASDPPPVPRRLSPHNPVTPGHNYTDRPVAHPVNPTVDSPQPPRERSPRRLRSNPQIRQPRESGQRRASTGPSGPNHPEREIIIAIMGAIGKIQTLFEVLIDWLR